MREQPMPNANLTSHFIQRYRERVARSGPERIQKFASEALRDGRECHDVKSSALRRKMVGDNSFHCSKSVMHKGFIYVFRGHTAITIYKIPKHVHGISVRV